MSSEKLEILTVPGIRLGSAKAGIKYQGRDDLVVIELATGSACSAVFTKNAFCAAPVIVAKEHLASAQPGYLLINAGNANAGTGTAGINTCRASCQALATLTGCEKQQILPFSTGVIGEPLPLERVETSIPKALSALSEENWPQAAYAIMTTDTRPKLISRFFFQADQQLRVTGMTKGSGMIRPDMATLLAFIATDASVEQSLLQRCLQLAVDPSFNSITVDGDTSTNDAAVLIATGVSGIEAITDLDSAVGRSLFQAVLEVCMELAKSIIKDGEGATKLVEILVEQAASFEEARHVAYTVAHSPLVKTALFASDPNWGRILAAVGRAGIQNMEIDRVEIWLNACCVVKAGERAEDYKEEVGQAVMAQNEFTIHILLGRGDATARVLTSDLSYDYVKINAEYRT